MIPGLGVVIFWTTKKSHGILIDCNEKLLLPALHILKVCMYVYIYIFIYTHLYILEEKTRIIIICLYWALKCPLFQDLDLTKSTACFFQICKDNYTKPQTERTQNQYPSVGKFCDCNRKDTMLLSNSHYLLKLFFLYNITQIPRSLHKMKPCSWLSQSCNPLKKLNT